MSLHPATREMLHGEVARLNKPGSAVSLWSRLRGFWPQIAFGSGLAVVLLVAVISLRAPLKQQSASRSAVAGADKRELPIPPNAVTERSAELETKLQDSASGARPEQTESRVTLQKDLAQPAPAAVAAEGEPAPMRQTAAETQLSLRGLAMKQQATGKETGPFNKPVTAEKLARANELTNLGAAMRVRFVELPERTRREARPPVLNSFQMEQSGDDLRFFDTDGSIYAGQLFPAVQNETRNALRQSFATERLALTGLTENVTEHYFRAEGTNRTLAKPVLLEGQYLERGTSGPAPDRTSSLATNNLKFKRAIVGRATIGQTNNFPVTAVSIEP